MHDPDDEQDPYPDGVAEYPDREAWKLMQLADENWMRALRAHRDSNDPATLPARLAITAASARQISAALAHAIGVGSFGWDPYPGRPDEDRPPGELHPDNMPPNDPRWQTLQQASHRVAAAVRQDDPQEVIDAYRAFAAACDYLRAG